MKIRTPFRRKTTQPELTDEDNDRIFAVLTMCYEDLINVGTTETDEMAIALNETRMKFLNANIR